MNLPQQPQLLTGNLAFVTSSSGETEFKHTTITPKEIAKQNIYPQQRYEMENKYWTYVSNYKKDCPILNKDVQQYNNQLNEIILKKNLQQKAISDTLSFNKKIGRISTLEYNIAAEIENTNHNRLILKKKHKPIIKGVDATFKQIILMYSFQIHNENELREKTPKRNTSRQVQMVAINPKALSESILNGNQVLRCCKKTVQNHVKSLIEAGVLFSHTYHGYYWHPDKTKRAGRCSEYHVNSEILTLFDDKTQKTLNSENQLFNYGFEKKLRYKEIVTRTYKNKSNINEIVDKKQSHHKEIKPLAELLPTFLQSANAENQNIYKNTNSVNQTKKLTRQNFECKNSDFLRQTVKPTSDFFHELTDGYHDNHKFKLKRHFEYQVLYGNLLKTEFFEVIVQEFMRIVAPLYKEKPVFYGSWHNSYQDIRELFLNNNGTIPSQTVLLYKFEGLLWRITYAKNYFRSKKNDCRALFPSEYFDPTRTTSKSGGFAYTLNFWKQKQEFEENKHKLKDEKRRAAAKRNQRYKAIETIETKVKQLVNGKITLTQLQDYVVCTQNIPIDIKKKLPTYIENAYKC